jgi:hypothetical protein
MQEAKDFESLDFLLWKAKDKKFINKKREGGESTDVAVGTRISFDVGSLRTGWVRWANSVPNFQNDTTPGIEEQHPDPSNELTGTGQDPWKRFAQVNVMVDGNKLDFNVEGMVGYGFLSDLFKGVMDLAGLGFNDIQAPAGLTVLPDFEVTYDGVKEFEAKAGKLGKPVWADLEIVADAAPSSTATDEKPVDNVEEDDIPF